VALCSMSVVQLLGSWAVRTKDSDVPMNSHLLFPQCFLSELDTTIAIFLFIQTELTRIDAFFNKHTKLSGSDGIYNTQIVVSVEAHWQRATKAKVPTGLDDDANCRSISSLVA
jgi:hypothetical protein